MLHRLAWTVDPRQRRLPREPHQRGVIVAQAIGLRADVGARREGVIDLPPDIIGLLILPLAVRADRKAEQRFDEPLGVGGFIGEIMRSSSDITRASFIIVEPEEADPVNHQPRIARDLRIDHAIERVGIGRAALHRDPRGKGGSAGGAGIGCGALGIVGLLGEQQGIDALVVIIGGQRRPVSGGDGSLVGSGKIGRYPRLARDRRRFGSPSSCGKRFGQSGPTIAGAGFVGAEESDDGRPIFAGAHLGFGGLAKPIVVGPVGIGDDEAGVIGEGVTVAGAKAAPVGKRIIDIGLRHGRSGVGWRVRALGNDRARRRGNQHEQESESSHARHCGGSVLINR